MADITGAGGEHRLQMPPAHGGGRQVRQVSAPEKWLNCFVRVVALTERVGNALGTLAFTWATVVLLGGYPTVLRPDDDFYYATSIIFIEATRMFSRNNRIDYQLFFRIRDSSSRVALALLRLIPQDYEQGDTESHENKTNLAASLNIFYGMVLGQGILYIAAFILEFFSFIPRRYLIRHGGFGGQWGVASVNLYYAYAFEKYMEGGVLAPKKISLITFAMESLNSDSPKMQQYGVQMLHIFLQKDPTRVRLIEKLTTSRKTMSRLISMLGWTSPNHKTVRVYAAKATVELAKCLPVITVPGTNTFILRSWRQISEYWSIPKEQTLTDHDLLPALGMSIVHNLVDCDENNCVEIDKATDLIPKIIGFTSFSGVTTNSKAQQMVLVKSSLKVLQRLTSIGGEIGIALRHKISKHPFLLRNLAEILGDNNSNQELIKLMAGILRNLAIDGDTRQKIGHMQVLITRLIKAFLNLDRTSNTKVDCLLPKVVGQALAMLATDNVHNCLIMLKEAMFINKLKNMILIHDENYIYVAASLLSSLCQHARDKLTESDLKDLSHILREVLERIMNVEGAELEILIRLSSQICKVIPEEFAEELEHRQIKQRFIKRLVDILNANINPGAYCPGIRRVVLEQSIYMMECNSCYASCFNEFQMMEALSMELTLTNSLNILIGLSSQICKVIPEEFVQELEGGQIKQRFMKKRVILEQSINMMEYNSHYANCFKELRMMEALSMVEEMPSRAENYRLFSGDTGLMEHSTPISIVVARAKELIARE
uniref:BLE2 protein n=1 Tax=Oryza rufipogon TaxID=4529 RepID=A0A0E0QC27_ORYRU